MGSFVSSSCDVCIKAASVIYPPMVQPYVFLPLATCECVNSCLLPSQSMNFFWPLTFEPPHDKTNKVACAPSQDSDQPGHPPSLIRVLAVHFMDSLRPKASSCGWMPRLIWVLAGCTVFLLVLSWGSSFSKPIQHGRDIWSDSKTRVEKRKKNCCVGRLYR